MPTAGGAVVVHFTAPWCRPCGTVERILDNLAAAYAHADFVKVDVDAHPELGARFGVLALPTVVLVRDGGPVATIEGARRRETYERALAEVVPAA